MRKRNLLCLPVLCALAWGSAVEAQVLSNEALFYRCYADMTGTRPTRNHPLLQAVRGGMPAVDACMQVLAKADLVFTNVASLSPAGTTSHVLADNTDAEARAVLNNFYQFHRKWFNVEDLSGIPGDSHQPDRFNDPTEPALFLTHVLFQNGVPYSDVVTGAYSVRGVRSLGPYFRQYFASGSNSVKLSIPGTGLDHGQLWGVATYDSSANDEWYTDAGLPVSTLIFSNDTQTISYTFQSDRSFGGGIMGLQSYILMNSGFPVRFLEDNDADLAEMLSGESNASKRMHRRWARNVAHDLLCRDVPLVRQTDVTSIAASYAGLYNDMGKPTYLDPSKQLPFRSSDACLSCHGALDPMAALIRAIGFPDASLQDWDGDGNPTHDATLADRITFLSEFSQPGSLLPAETPPNGEYNMMLRDAHFAERPDSGDLRYRSYDGSLVWQHFTASPQGTAQGNFDGLAQMGAWLAADTQTKDLYVCAASRYLEYFTGIHVYLSDAGDPRNIPPTADDAHYQMLAVQLGTHLQQTQSLQALIKDILSSQLYQKRGMRD